MRSWWSRRSLLFRAVGLFAGAYLLLRGDAPLIFVYVGFGVAGLVLTLITAGSNEDLMRRASERYMTANERQSYRMLASYPSVAGRTPVAEGDGKGLNSTAQFAYALCMPACLVGMRLLRPREEASGSWAL